MYSDRMPPTRRLEPLYLKTSGSGSNVPMDSTPIIPLTAHTNTSSTARLEANPYSAAMWQIQAQNIAMQHKLRAVTNALNVTSTSLEKERRALTVSNSLLEKVQSDLTLAKGSLTKEQKRSAGLELEIVALKEQLHKMSKLNADLQMRRQTLQLLHLTNKETDEEKPNNPKKRKIEEEDPALISAVKCTAKLCKNALFKNRAALDKHTRKVHGKAFDVEFRGGAKARLNRNEADGKLYCPCKEFSQTKIQKVRIHCLQCIGEEVVPWNEIVSSETVPLNNLDLMECAGAFRKKYENLCLFKETPDTTCWFKEGPVRFFVIPQSLWVEFYRYMVAGVPGAGLKPASPRFTSYCTLNEIALSSNEVMGGSVIELEDGEPLKNLKGQDSVVLEQSYLGTDAFKRCDSGWDGNLEDGEIQEELMPEENSDVKENRIEMDLENGNSLNDKLLEQTLDGKLKIGQRVDDRTLEEDLVEDIPSLGIVDNTSSSDGVDEYESAVCHQTILFKMMPEFDLIPFELKIAIQKGIAAFLEEEECPVEVVESVDIQDEGTLEFYAIPESLEGEFKSWLCQFTCPVEVVDSVDIQDEGTLDFYAIP